MEEKLLSATQVAAMLGLSLRSVYRMKAVGLICPCLRVGQKAIRWRQSSIEAWLSMGCCNQKEFLKRKEGAKCHH